MISSIRSSSRWAALALAFALGVCACGAEDDGNPYVTPPPNSVLGDAQVAVDGGTTPPPGLGGTSPEAAVGAANDAQVVAPVDAQVSLDARPASEAGGPTDAGPSLSDATSQSDASTGDSALPVADQGKGDGKDVITIGDSWMLLTLTGVQTGLKKASGQPYRTYGFPGTQVLTGAIPGQFDDAVRADPDIKTVVMTGGGNDILLTGAGADCETGGPNCTAQLDKIAKALDALWTKMSQKGVLDVVHVMYSAAAVKNNPVKNLPAHNERIRAMCSSHPPMRCFQLNTDNLAMDLRLDGIHPTDAGYDRIGKAVFDMMVKEGMRR